MTHWIVTTLKATALSHFVIQATWVWPLCETLHFVGLTMLIGVVGLLDLRLMGHFRHLSLRAVHNLIPWGIAGFTINLVTGALFFIGAPDQYLGNIAFYIKLLFLLVAGLNVLYFETTQARTIESIGPGVDTPRALKLIGAVSVFAWFMVLYWGRMLPFIGTAF